MMTTTATQPMAGGGRGGRSCTKFPFTATQWQELEHQALIYKYMTSGVPIPPDLLFTIKRSLDTSLSSNFLANYHPSTTALGWNAFNQMGYGKKIDPEPGRCRRTDGKKWRCSKEAYPDSKYCERHMHRGKNRSRKPVEINPANPNNFISSASSNSSNNNNNNCINVATVASNSANNNPCSSTNTASLTHQSSLMTKPTSSLSSLPSSDSPYNFLYSHPYYHPKDYTSRERNYNGMKEEVGEHAIFTENTGSSMIRGMDDQSWQLRGYNNPNNQMKQEEKQCYIWGRDFNCDLSMRVEEEERENNDNKTIHHFIDESPSTTQLSISMPSSTTTTTTSHHHHHDFFLSNSRTHHHDR